jgi:hypothetical protein
MNVLTNIELDYLKRMIDDELDLSTWNYSEYGAGCTFSKNIDDLTYTVWYSGSIVQLDIMKIENTPYYSSRLGIRLNDVAGWHNKKILYRNKMYSKSGCTVLGKDEISEETYNSVMIVLDKLEQHKDTWRLFYKGE